MLAVLCVSVLLEGAALDACIIPFSLTQLSGPAAEKLEQVDSTALGLGLGLLLFGLVAIFLQRVTEIRRTMAEHPPVC